MFDKVNNNDITKKKLILMFKNTYKCYTLQYDNTLPITKIVLKMCKACNDDQYNSETTDASTNNSLFSD